MSCYEHFEYCLIHNAVTEYIVIFASEPLASLLRDKCRGSYLDHYKVATKSVSR